MNSVLFHIVFVFLAIPYQMRTEPQYDAAEDFVIDRESQYYCHKLKSCTPGGPKVCGYDQYKPWLAEFQDICILYKTNCERSGRFYPVDQVVCDTRIKYDKEHVNETFIVIHVRPTSADRPVLKSAGAATRKRSPVKLVKAH